MDTGKEKARVPILSMLAVLIIYTTGSFGVQKLGEMFFGAASMGASQGLSQLLLLFLPVFLISRAELMPFRETFRFNFTFNRNIFLYSLLGLAGIQIFALAFPVVQSAFLPESIKTALKSFEKSYSGIMLELLGKRNSFSYYFNGLVVMSIIPAFTEEMVFRGYLQTSLEKSLKAPLAIIVTSIVFCLAHFNPVDLVALLFIGALLGIAAYYSGSIFIPMIIHFLNNILAFVSISFQYEEFKFGASPDMSLQTSLPFLFVGLALLLLSFMLIKREKC